MWSFLYFHWLFSLLARESSSGNYSIYKATLESMVCEMDAKFTAVIVIHEYIYSNSTNKFAFKKYICLKLTTYFFFRNIFTHIYGMYSSHSTDHIRSHSRSKYSVNTDLFFCSSRSVTRVRTGIEHCGSRSEREYPNKARVSQCSFPQELIGSCSPASFSLRQY